jgi:hypothetical protein
MPRELLNSAIEQARDADALVRTMALLGASRALSAIEKDDARRVFLEGVAGAERLSISEHQRTLVIDQAVRIGATVHPAAAIELHRRQPPGGYLRSHATGSVLVQALVKSGDAERAVALLEDLACDVGGAGTVLHGAHDPGLKARAMFAARERWRARRGKADRFRDEDREFYPLVSFYWRLLGPEEASRWLDEIMLAIESQDPNERVHFGFGRGVELHTSRDVHLFHVLNMLRALRPPHDVEAIFARYPDVAIAAKTFPLGYESVVTQAAPAPTERGGQKGGFCFTFAGPSSRRGVGLVPTMMAAHRGERSSVGALVEDAHRAFREDTDPLYGNLAPLAFWPSCVAYRRALYWAGRIIGSDAKSLVSEVPERELALLASIELASGLLGLDEFSWIQAERRPSRE